MKKILLIAAVAVSLSACSDPNQPQQVAVNCGQATPSAFILTRGSFSMPHITMRAPTYTPHIYTSTPKSTFRSAPPSRSYSAPRSYSGPSVIVMQHHYVYHYSNPYFYYAPFYDPFYHSYYNGAWGFSSAPPANVNVTCPTGT